MLQLQQMLQAQLLYATNGRHYEQGSTDTELIAVGCPVMVCAVSVILRR